nr:hypothetical protein [uncultured Holophaga sp.]
MSALTPSASWDDVTQIETTTAVLGGEGGPANTPHQELLNRTEFLKNKLGSITGLATTTPAAVGASSAVGTGTTAARADHVHGVTTALLNTLGAALGQSLNTNGYQKLPGGLVIQWGQASGSEDAWTTHAFPTTFPNGCFVIVAGMMTGSANTGGQNCYAKIISTSQYAVMSNEHVTTIGWIAVGY